MKEPDDAGSNQMILSTQIIHVAMTLGVLVFLGAAWVMKPLPREGESVNLFLILCMVVAGAGFLMSLVIPALIGNAMAGVLAKREMVTTADLLQVIQKRHIIRLALLEGPAILPGVFVILTGNPIFLGISLTLMVIMAMFFPTRGKITEQAQALEDRIAMLRQSGG